MTPPPTAPPSTASQGIFGSPPLIPGENLADYQKMLALVLMRVRPKQDFFEHLWVRDVVNLEWEVRRLRRLKASLLEGAAYKGLEEVLEPLMPPIGWGAKKDLSKRWARREPEALKEVENRLASAGIGIDVVMAQTLAMKLDAIERFDRLLASAETRRNAALREIERHRATLATALHLATQEVEDAEFEEVGAAASETQAP